MTIDVHLLRVWSPETLVQAARDLSAISRQVDEVAGELGTAARSISQGWSGSASQGALAAIRAQERAAQNLLETLRLIRLATIKAGDALIAAKAELARAETYAAEHDLTITARTVATLPDDAPADQQQARQELRAMIRAILVAADEADCDGARAVRAALNVAALSRQEVADLINEAGVTDIPVNEGPTYIASLWASLSPDAQALLLRDHPEIIGNLDGVPFDVRVAANRVNITNALADVQQSIPDLEQRLSEAQARWDENLASGTPDGTLGAELSTEISQLEQELDDARRHAEMYDRLLNEDTVRYENGARTTGRGHQVVLFDPENGAFAEIVGNLDAATQNIAVMVPGTGSNFLNMTGPDSAYDRCESFVTADDVKPDGSLAVVSWIGGPLPQDLITEAPQARFAGDLAPRLASFTDGLTNPGDVPVTVVGHSYGGSVVGLAEARGMHVDRVLHVESAGAGPGVGDIDEYAYPDTDRYSMTAPGDLIGYSQGVESLDWGHGADPDGLSGVVQLETGLVRADDPSSGVLHGPGAHSGVFTRGSTAFNNILGVMTGGEVSLYADPYDFYGGTDPVEYLYPMENPDYRPPTMDVP